MRKVLLVLLVIFLIIWMLPRDPFVPTYENIAGTYHYEGENQKNIDLYTLEILPDSTFIARYRKNPDDSIQVHRGKIVYEDWVIEFSTDPDSRNHYFVRDSLMEYEGIDYFLNGT